MLDHAWTLHEPIQYILTRNAGLVYECAIRWARERLFMVRDIPVFPRLVTMDELHTSELSDVDVPVLIIDI